MWLSWLIIGRSESSSAVRVGGVRVAITVVVRNVTYISYLIDSTWCVIQMKIGGRCTVVRFTTTSKLSCI